MHEAVYESLLASRQKVLHRQIAVELERRYADRPQTHSEALAHHFQAAGDTEKAIDYLLMSGDKRFAMYALQDADRAFKSAIELVEAPGRPTRLRLAELAFDGCAFLSSPGLAASSSWRSGFFGSRTPGRLGQLRLMLGNYGHALLHRHNYREAYKVACQGLEMSERLGAGFPPLTPSWFR